MCVYQNYFIIRYREKNYQRQDSRSTHQRLGYLYWPKRIKRSKGIRNRESRNVGEEKKGCSISRYFALFSSMCKKKQLRILFRTKS